MSSTPHHSRDSTPFPSVTPRHVRRAEEYMRCNVQRRLTTATVARHAGVSVRTLFDGFVAYRSMTPSRFLRQLRLEGAHADLLSEAKSVAEVAHKWGFGHSGNFAAHYARRFGEAPSQTLW